MSKFGPMKVESVTDGEAILNSADDVERGEAVIMHDSFSIYVSYDYDYIDDDGFLRASDDTWKTLMDLEQLNELLSSRFGVELTAKQFEQLMKEQPEPISATSDHQCPVCKQDYLDKWEEGLPDGQLIGYVHVYDTTYHEDDPSYGCFKFTPRVEAES